MKLTNVHRKIKLTDKYLRRHGKKRSRKANAILTLFPSQIRSVLVAGDHPYGQGVRANVGSAKTDSHSWFRA